MVIGVNREWRTSGGVRVVGLPEGVSSLLNSLAIPAEAVKNVWIVGNNSGARASIGLANWGQENIKKIISKMRLWCPISLYFT